MTDIGREEKEIEVIPIRQPMTTPEPAPAPSAPVPAPAPVPVPA